MLELSALFLVRELLEDVLKQLKPIYFTKEVNVNISEYLCSFDFWLEFIPAPYARGEKLAWLVTNVYLSY